MEKIVKRKGKFEWWFWLGSILLILGLSVSALILFYVQPWLIKQLHLRVKEESRGLYQLQVGELHTSFLTGIMTLKNIVLLPDYEVWENQHKAKNNKAPNLLVELKADELHLRGLNAVDLLRKKPLKLRKLVLMKPILHINQMNDNLSFSRPLHTQLKGAFGNLKIENFQIKNGTLSYKRNYKNRANDIKLHEINLNVKGLQVDSSSFYDKKRVYYTRAIDFNAKKLKLLSPDGYYSIQVDFTDVSTEAKTLLLKRVAIVPLYKPKELARRKRQATTWLKINIPDLQVSNIDYHKLFNQSTISVGTVQVQSPRLHAFLDRKNFEQQGENPLPHDLIQKLKVGLSINKVLIKNMHIRYEELAPEATDIGLITFEKLYATLTNISNNKSLSSAKAPAVLNLNAALMGKAALKATIKLYLLDPGGYHTITGSFGKMDVSILNKILEPTAFVSVKSGTLQKSNFSFKLNRNTASGKMRAYYQDLKVELLSKDKDKRQSFGKRILSAIVNKVVIDSENTPDTKDGLRLGKINVIRKKNRSVFNYWKNCLASGFLSSSGIDNLPQAKE